MFLNDSSETQWDLRFRFLGFPVRVHPMFWLMALIFSGGLHSGQMADLVVGVFVVFISILIHETGHALAMAHYGQRAQIVLTGFGGYAAPENDLWSGSTSRARSPQQQILISAAGPGAGFLLAIAGYLLLVAAQGRAELVWALPFPYVLADTAGTALDSPIARAFIWQLLNINVVWGLLNLLPVFPLDGGQIARQLFVLKDPWRGQLNATLLSLIVAAAVAVIAVSTRSIWLALLFGSLAFSNWEAYQQLGGRGRRW